MKKPIDPALFWSQVEKGDGCWPWRGPVTPEGYGLHRTQCAHRIAYELVVGPIPAGLNLDHLCRVPGCVNPEHLEPVTQRENLMRGVGTLAGINAAKTHCKRGHPFDAANTYRYRGARQCRACHADRERRRKAVRHP